MTIQRVLAIAAAAFITSCAQAPTVLTGSVPGTGAPGSTSEVTRENADGARTAPALTPSPRDLSTEAFAPPALGKAPVPLTQTGQPAAWWFVFKFNAKSFPSCGATTVTRSCPFGGTVQP